MKNIFKMVKRFSRNSIFFTTLKKFILIIMIPFVVISFSFSIYYYHSIKNDYEEIAANSFQEIRRSLERLTTNTEHIFYTLVTIEQLDIFFQMNSPTQSNAQIYAALSRLRSHLNAQNDIFDSILSIQLYNDMGFSLSSQETLVAGNLMQNGALSKVPATMSFWIPQTVTSSAGESISTFSIVYNYYASNRHGYIVFNIDPDFLPQMPVKSSSLYIMNTNLETIYATNQDIRPMEGFTIGDNLAIEQNDTVLYLTALFNDKVIHLCIESEFQFSSVICSLILYLVLSIIMATVLSLIVSVDSYRMLRSIILSFGFPDESKNQERQNELTYIADNIMDLYNQNQSFATILAEKMNELKRLQNTMLQMQFTPHFLFNTLNAVNLIAFRELGPENEIEQIIVRLSDLLTQSLNTKHYVVQIEEELAYTRIYIEIEQIKSKNTFETVWNIDPATTHYKVPKFILQPLVENTFRHGIKYLSPNKKGRLAISCTQANSDIVLQVKDNGIGIPKEKLAILKNKLKEDNLYIQKHIGLSNINSRIGLFFGSQYGLEIDSDATGTTVTILIPKKE